MSGVITNGIWITGISCITAKNSSGITELFLINIMFYYDEQLFT